MVHVNHTLSSFYQTSITAMKTLTMKAITTHCTSMNVFYASPSGVGSKHIEKAIYRFLHNIVYNVETVFMYEGLPIA